MDKLLIEAKEKLPIYKRKLLILMSFLIFAIILLVLVILFIDTDSSSNKSELSTNNNFFNNFNLINEGNDEKGQYIPYMCLDENKNPSKKCIGGWFYHTTDYTPEYNAEFAKNKGWNYVLLSANIKEPKIIKIIQEFRKKNISVHFMTLQDIAYLDKPESVYDKIKNILIFVNENGLDIQGIHIDCEPHAKSEWKNGNSEIRTKIFQNYTKILENCRNAINDYRPNITFSAAVGWFYSSKTQNGEIVGGRGYELVNEKRLDFIIPMIYDGAGGTITNIIKRSEDYINDEANTIIGLDVKDYNENLNEMINLVFENRENSNYFYGVSIYSNHRYSDWGN